MNEIHSKISKKLLQDIICGEKAIGSRLLTERELAVEFGTNRTEARKALAWLEQAGMVKRLKRHGTFVSENATKANTRRLLARKSNRVHVLCFDSRGHNIHHWNELTLSTLEQHLCQHGYQMVVKTLISPPTRPRVQALIREITDEHSHTLIILPDAGATEIFCRQHLDLWAKHAGQIFILSRGSALIEDWPYHAVRLDPHGAGMLVGNILHHREIESIWYACRHFKVTANWQELREKGLVLGLGLYECQQFPEDRRLCGRDAMIDFCQRVDQMQLKPTVVVSQDPIASELIKIANGCGLSVPDDLEIVGFDDNPQNRGDAITTATYPKDAIGTLFARLITDRPSLVQCSRTIALTVPHLLIERSTCVLSPVERHTLFMLTPTQERKNLITY